MCLKSMSRDVMREIELKSLKRLSGFLALKKTVTQLIISVSIFSLVFSWSSLSSSSLVYYQNLHYLSTISFHPITTIAMNKNYIFLICNGILFFLAQTRPPSASDIDDVLQKKISNGPQVETEAQTLSDNHITLDEDEDEEETKTAYEGEEVEVDREFEHSISIAESDEEREIELQDCCLFHDGEEEESNGGEEVDEIGKLSDDELNQKFEDFITRMKEEFRIDDNQQKKLVLLD